MTAPLPAGYAARHPLPDDAEEIVEMINASSLAYASVPIVNVEQLHGMWSLPGHTPDDDWLAVTPEGGIAAVATTFALQPYSELQGLGVVHPEHEQRGLGAWALGRVEERAGHYLALAPAGAAVMLHAQTFGVNPRADALYRAHGFELARVFKLMSIDFDAAGHRWLRRRRPASPSARSCAGRTSAPPGRPPRSRSKTTGTTPSCPWRRGHSC